MRDKIVAFVLAGGKGNRLLPLTQDRAKPAVPFGGKYRIVDFVLSNLINSGIFSIYVVVQYRSQSLLKHLRDGWQFSGLLKSQFIIPTAAEEQAGEEGWYRGTADAVLQNLDLIDDLDQCTVAIFGADHVYRMNIERMVDFHHQRNADVTVAAIPVSAHLSTDFGVIEAGADGAIHGFYEKDIHAPTIPGKEDQVYASMGNYLFSGRVLRRELHADVHRSGSRRDFGYDILPSMLGRAAMYAYDFQSNILPGESGGVALYWRDLGTLDAYYEAQMDLCGLVPSLNLYNPLWPIHTASYSDPCAKFSYDKHGNVGSAVGSIVSGGCIFSGGTVRGSVVGRGVRIKGESLVEDSIVLDNCVIGAGCKIRRAILDEGVTIPDGQRIGYDAEEDRRKHHVSESGIVVCSRRIAS
ncbi:MAG TPA: glucose-1-phosphate adenylyltransferase [Terracidiphilus sp.]|nr:glucose-1-phosphate adenylyltransferase [Terracidiphilus sp.]